MFITSKHTTAECTCTGRDVPGFKTGPELKDRLSERVRKDILRRNAGKQRRISTTREQMTPEPCWKINTTKSLY